MVTLELTIVVAAALFFSAIVVTPTLAGLFTVAVFVAGRSSGYLSFFTTGEQGAVLRAMSRALYWLLPHLDRLNVAGQVAYGEPVSAAYVGAATAYALAYAAAVLVLTVALFARREFL
jgi:hypothetical protein